MDAINFVNFLKNPGYLHQVTFQELNNLIEQYPFCQNLHYLALRKAQNENHRDFVKKLELAATYCPNRQWLYKQLQDIQDPDAISDLEEEKEKDLTIVEANSAIPLSEEEIPVPNEINEETPIPEEEIEEISNEFQEGSLIDSDQDVIPSHSISDSDQTMDALINPIDGPDVEIHHEAPEDSKLQSTIDQVDIYKEVPFEEKSFIQEDPPLIKVKEDEIAIPLEEVQPDTEQGVEESGDNPVTDIDLNPGKDHLKNIPFEIFHPGLEEEEEEEEEEVQLDTSDVKTEHDMDDHLTPPEKPLSNASFLDETPVASFEEEEEEEIKITAEDLEQDKKEEKPSFGEHLEIEDQGTKAEPMPKSAFSSWRQASSSLLKPSQKKKSPEKKEEKKTVYEVTDLFKEKAAKNKSTDKKSRKKDTKRKKKKKRTRGFAMESLLQHDDVISETLAELLAEQGRKKKAVKMYKRLSQIHPEKKEAFAIRILELKNKD